MSNNFIVFRVQREPGSGTRSRGPGATTFSGEEELKAEITEADLSPGDLDALRRDPDTVVAQPMPLTLIQPLETADGNAPMGTEGNNAWGIEAVGAHQSAFDGDGVVVAVLDTGIDPNHVAFEGVELMRKNFTSEIEDDLNGHGTHCAGTIFGRDVDGTRIGVARGVRKALIGKVLGRGGGSSATLANAINWALENGANVISMSLGIDFPGYVDSLVNQRNMNIRPATSLALSNYRDNVNLFSSIADYLAARSNFATGVMVVAASGNESKRPDYEIDVAPPAAGNGITAVGALQRGTAGLSVANFSNTGCSCSAPGVGIRSAKVGGGLKDLSGTSMATPHVAGVAALWAQKEQQETGRITTSNIIAKVVGNATLNGLAPGTLANDVGAGIVQSP